MKIRSGFVSNSSSSSFCIFGAYVNGQEEKMLAVLKERFANEPDKMAKLEEISEDDTYELLELYSEEFDLEYVAADSEYYLGRSYSGIGEDETGKQFRESVSTKLDVLGVKSEHHEGEYYC